MILSQIGQVLTGEASISKNLLGKLFVFARGSFGFEKIIRAGIKIGVKRGDVVVDDGRRVVVRSREYVYNANLLSASTYKNNGEDIWSRDWKNKIVRIITLNGSIRTGVGAGEESQEIF